MMSGKHSICFAFPIRHTAKRKDAEVKTKTKPYEQVIIPNPKMLRLPLIVIGQDANQGYLFKGRVLINVFGHICTAC